LREARANEEEEQPVGCLEVEGGYLVRFEVGEKLPHALAEFCRKQDIPAATAEGLGAIRDVVLGYYDIEARAYRRTQLPGSWELLSLFADIATWRDDPFPHTHVVVSGPDCVARGGHLFEGTVSVTAEIRIWTIDRPVRRKMNEEVGLHLLEI
jgi:predicted DNA-binding protein with PD1-like motif